MQAVRATGLDPNTTIESPGRSTDVRRRPAKKKDDESSHLEICNWPRCTGAWRLPCPGAVAEQLGLGPHLPLNGHQPAQEDFQLQEDVPCVAMHVLSPYFTCEVFQSILCILCILWFEILCILCTLFHTMVALQDNRKENLK